MMKKVNYLFVILLFAFLGACEKAGPEGAMGNQGKDGAQGAHGPEGKQGVPGTNGKMIYYGNIAPNISIGEEGDFYIDKSNSNLYGPKSSTSWGEPSSMKGAQGDKGLQGDKGVDGKDGTNGIKGEAGSQFLSGPIDPHSSVGRSGDFYFNTTSGTLFGPKAIAWPTGINLKGLKGDKGDKGEIGPAGKDGNANVIATDWVSFPEDKWTTTLGVGSTLFREPGDVSSLVVPYAFSFDRNFNFDGVILMYVDDGRSVKIPPFGKFLIINGTSAYTDFRIVMSNFSNQSKFIHLVSASKTVWSAADYMSAKVELAKLKFKLVMIPSSVVQAKAFDIKSIDLKDLKAVSKMFDLKY